MIAEGVHDAGVGSAGRGFIEAHGLALIFGVLLSRATPSLAWHLGAASVHLLLGGANLAFWRFFIEADMLAVGVGTTTAHALFAALQLVAARRLTSMDAQLASKRGR